MKVTDKKQQTRESEHTIIKKYECERNLQRNLIFEQLKPNKCYFIEYYLRTSKKQAYYSPCNTQIKKNMIIEIY